MMKTPGYRTYPSVLVPNVGAPKLVVHEDSGRIIDGILIRRLTFGTSLNVHCPPSADPLPVEDGDVIDLADYDFTGPVALSTDVNPGRASVTVTVVFRDSGQ